jgi:DGQHR domain-containing protein
MNPRRNVIVRRALRIIQAPGAPALYLFSLTADEIFKVADISRVSRDQKGDLIGYQRPEVRKHVREIADYLNSERPLFPNAIILALSPSVRFTGQRGPKAGDGYAVPGKLEITLPNNGEPRPAWMVDGQQRAFALAESKNGKFPVPVSGFVAETIELQRDQFIRVNNTKPLPSRLITELLPEIASPISSRLAARQLPSALVDGLNRDEHSPFRGLIKRASTASEDASAAVVTDTSLVNAIEESLRTGCLAVYRNLAGQYDTDSIWQVLLCYWTAVRDAFPDAWGKPSTESRLMHGVGMRAMGHLMDRMMGSLNIADKGTPEIVGKQLQQLAPHCHWTSGRWDELDMNWDQLQNVSKHIQMLSHHLVRLYVLGSGQG